MRENRDLFRLTEEDMNERRDGEVRFLDPRGHIGFDIFIEERDEPVGDEGVQAG